MSENAKGILCLAGALVFLTISDSIIKWLSPYYALHQIMLFRAFFALLVVLVFIFFGDGVQSLKTRRPALHILRGMFLVFANMFFFLGLSTMPLGETVALFFIAPLFICLLAQPILGEKVGLTSWAAIGIGLVGVLIMVRPGTDLFRITSLLPILAALMYAGMQIVTRKLGLQDRASTMTFYIQICFILASIVIGLIVGDGRFDNSDNPTAGFLLRAWRMPDWVDLQLLALCGFVVAFGGYFISQAYRIGQASIIAPFEYTSLPLALIVGYLIWGDWPDIISFVGCAFIISGGLIVALFDKRLVAEVGVRKRP